MMRVRVNRRVGALTAMSWLVLVVCLAALTASTAVWGQAPAQPPAPSQPVFRAGAVTSNITPALGISLAGSMTDHKGTHVHDELHARCLVLDDGAAKLAIVLVDNCLIPREIFDEAKRRLEAQCGIPASHMLMAATHSHSAPTVTHVFQSLPDENYIPFLIQRIVDGVQRAINQLEPARIAWGNGSLPGEVFCRRWRMKPEGIDADPFGNKNDTVRMNPPRASEHLIEPAGPTDPEVSVVALQALDGRPIALLANYSLHYVGGVGGGHISADYFGMFAERIKELIGAGHLDPPFVGIMSNGTSGNINNINFREAGVAQGPYEQMRHVAYAAADEAKKAYDGLQWRDFVKLDAAVKEIQLGVRKPSEEELARAREIVAAAEGPVMKGLPEIYARETVYMSEYPDTVPLIVQALRIGDLAIAAIPCETFTETGLEIKAKTPFADTFTIQLANGYNGYLPTPEQHKFGGYETWRAKSSYLEVNASNVITATVMELFGQLNARKGQ